MERAQQKEIVDVGAAVGDPVLDVVAVQEAVAPAPRETAAVVTAPPEAMAAPNAPAGPLPSPPRSRAREGSDR